MRVLILFALIAVLGAADLRLVTWNVLADPADRVERGAALREILAATRADVICLQEVAPWFLDQILADRRFAGLRRTVIGDKVLSPGGCFLLSRWPINARIEVLPSRLDRVALVADLAHPQGEIRVAVIHLDSLIGVAWQEIRARQLVATVQALEGATEALIVGDANFGDGEPEAQALPTAFRDAWTVLHPDDPGLTWDRATNPRADAGSLPAEDSRRLDRIWLRTQAWEPMEMQVVGRPSHEGDIPPSDHYGLFLRLVRADG